jgi:hypothetical protein
MNASNQVVKDFYLLPRIDMTSPHVRLAEYNGIFLDAYRFDSLEPLFGMGARATLMEFAS